MLYNVYVPISLAANIQEFVVTHQCLIGFMATKAASGRKVNRSIELFFGVTRPQTTILRSFFSV